MTRRPYYDGISLLILGLGAVVAMAGCSKSVQVGTQDQAMVPGPKAGMQAEAPTVQAPKEEVRVTEPPVAEASRETAEAAKAAEEARAPEVAAAPTPAERPTEKTTEQPAAAAPKLAELADVFFDYDKFSIRMDASPILDANARLLKAENGWKLVIAGHCDERGTSAYNLVLGERRAQAAKKYLADLGVPASQIQVTSYGKEKPFCAEHSQECWQKNRRAHFSAQ